MKRTSEPGLIVFFTLHSLAPKVTNRFSVSFLMHHSFSRRYWKARKNQAIRLFDINENYEGRAESAPSSRVSCTVPFPPNGQLTCAPIGGGGRNGPFHFSSHSWKKNGRRYHHQTLHTLPSSISSILTEAIFLIFYKALISWLWMTSKHVFQISVKNKGARESSSRVQF